MNAKEQAFIVIFFGEVKGYIRGKTIAGTAARYAADAGLNPHDADLKLIKWAQASISQITEAQRRGEIKILR